MAFCAITFSHYFGSVTFFKWALLVTWVLHTPSRKNGSLIIRQVDGWFGLGWSVLVWSQDDEHCNLIQIKTADFFHFALVASHYCFITKVIEVADSGDGLWSLD